MLIIVISLTFVRMYGYLTNFEGCLNLSISHTTILQYQLTLRINVFQNNGRFWASFMNFFDEPIMWTWWCFIAKVRIKFIDPMLLHKSTSKVINSNSIKMLTVLAAINFLSYYKPHNIARAFVNKFWVRIPTKLPKITINTSVARWQLQCCAISKDKYNLRT